VETEAQCNALEIEYLMTEMCTFIYPNPTDGIIYIDFSNGQVQKLTISDITGKRIFQETGIHQKESIDLSDLISGVYIISIQTDEKIFTSKFIKR